MLVEWIVDNTDLWNAVDGEAKGDADVGVAVHEVGGAVYGVDDEAGSVRDGAGGGSGFLAEEPIGWKKGIRSGLEKSRGGKGEGYA